MLTYKRLDHSVMKTIKSLTRFPDALLSMTVSRPYFWVLQLRLKLNLSVVVHF